MNGQDGNANLNQAPQSAPQTAPAVNQMPAQSAPMPSSANDEFADLRRFAAAGAERMARTGVNDNVQGTADSGTPDPNGNDLTLPAGLVDNAAARAVQVVQPQVQQQAQQQLQQQPTNPQTQNQQAQPQNQQQQQNQQPNQQQQPPVDQAEQQARELSKVVLRNAQGQTMEFDNDQLLSMLQGFHHYNSQIQNIQQDYNQRYQSLESVRQQIEAKQAHIDSLMKSEKGFILEALESNQPFADKVAALLSEQPELLATYQNRKVDAVQNQGSDRIAQLEQQVQNFLQAQQQQAAQAEQVQRQNFYNNTVNTVQQNVAEINKQYNLPPKTIESLTAQAVLEVQAGNLKFEPQAITNYFKQQMHALSLDLGTIKDQVRSEYLSLKQQAAPPPPTGGGTPSVVNQTPTTPAERVRMVANLLQSATNANR